jgi:hypothetical protein
VGSDISIFARTFHIYDCDQYTREFYANVNQPQPQKEEPPIDNFEKMPKKDIKVHDRGILIEY